ncbi:uncharacterized protein LY79DRAFT_534940 [Colletotrichum navitas]|uniref:Uncharacterized protein n=1 Tax=Colletotrichum navitas TaxID=681940 RepID=A0AAD8QBK9_9PEZI|nr:uncharacterized protein LY79DRAFT_534940 [Colletotrichum navitas]KAK1599395.1 hypothetical protein LY79DRAFT_534940 [Colletotrichum navitas]
MRAYLLIYLFSARTAPSDMTACFFNLLFFSSSLSFDNREAPLPPFQRSRAWNKSELCPAVVVVASRQTGSKQAGIGPDTRMNRWTGGRGAAHPTIQSCLSRSMRPALPACELAIAVLGEMRNRGAGPDARHCDWSSPEHAGRAGAKIGGGSF